MKLTNVGNMYEFFETVDKCEGRVELVTEQGDCLNLCKKISQFVVAVKMATETSILQGDIISYNRNDMELLMRHMQNC